MSRNKIAQDSDSIKVKPVHAKTKNQQLYIDTILDNRITFCTSPSGAGKTHIAVGVGLNLLFKREVSKIILTRPVIEVGESIGYLKGSYEEKLSPHLACLFDELSYYLTKSQLEQMLNNGRTGHKGGIEIAPLGFMRGRSFVDAFIIGDEFQNASRSQIKMFLTRISHGSRMVITGDLKQSDINDSGLEYVTKNLRGIKNIGFVSLTTDDIQRDPIIGEILDRI